MFWNRLRGHLVSALRSYFGRELTEREAAISPAQAAEKHLPSMMTIFNHQRMWGPVTSRPARLAAARLAREEEQVYAALRVLQTYSGNRPADLTSIRIAHWFNMDSSHYRPVDVRGALARLQKKGRVYEFSRWGGRKKWIAGNLLELLARAAQ